MVTGGFHSPGLALSEEHADWFGAMEAKEKELPKEDKGVYVMPYSMEAADALNGYASGMPFMTVRRPMSAP